MAKTAKVMRMAGSAKKFKTVKLAKNDRMAELANMGGKLINIRAKKAKMAKKVTMAQTAKLTEIFEKPKRSEWPTMAKLLNLGNVARMV